MEQKFVTEMHQRLIKQKEELLETLVAENEDFKALVNDIDPKDLADIAADDIDRNTLETISSNDTKRLMQIDSALSRIKNGKYGVCLSCGKNIGRERLEAIPYAFKCIECQKADETRKRKYA